MAGKRLENRSRRTNYRGPILIHAGLKRDKDGEATLHSMLRGRSIPAFEDFERGVVVARAVLVGVLSAIDDKYLDSRDEQWRRVPRNQYKWFFGPFAYVLADVVPTYPVALRGQLGIFDAGPIRVRKLR